jgi:hypothetical protein
VTDDGPVGCQQCGVLAPGGRWCARCLKQLSAREGSIDEDVARSLRNARTVSVYSRVRAGPVTFGPLGRVLWSVVPVVVSYVAVRNVYRSMGEVTVAFYGVMAVPVLLIAGYFLAQVWKRDRVE